MTDDSATANASRTGQSLTTASPRCAAFRGPGPRLVLFVLLFSTLGARTLVAHDVIDIELNLVTNGGVTGDEVGPHTDYLSAFPYLGNPHDSSNWRATAWEIHPITGIEILHGPN